MCARGVLPPFFPRQGAFDAARMDREAELGADRSCECAGSRWMFVRHLRLDERHDLGSELVRAAGPASLRQQASKTLLREGRLGLVVRRTREAKKRSGLGLLGSLDADLAQHLVLHLHKIPGVEEAFGLEPGLCSHLGRTRWKEETPSKDDREQNTGAGADQGVGDEGAGDAMPIVAARVDEFHVVDRKIHRGGE